MSFRVNMIVITGVLLTTLVTISTGAVAKQSFFENVRYLVNSDSDKQTLDIYGPEKRPDGAPVLIYVHGGGWQLGDKKNNAIRGSVYYTDKGAIVVSVNYRLSPDVKHPAHIEDLASAVKWIYQNIHTYGGDRSKMILTGHSSGAQMVALLGTNTRFLKEKDLPMNIFKAIVPVDTASFDLVNLPEGRGSFMIERMRENAFGSDPEVLLDASPFHQVPPEETALSPFAIFATGKRPEAVQQGTNLAQALREKGHQAVSTEMDSSLSHMDMNIAIFKPDTQISNFILRTLELGPETQNQ